MGSGIAEVCARAGLDVVVVEANEDAKVAGSARIEKSLERGVRSGKLPEGDRDSALGLLTFATEMEALADREIVVEAVIESEDAKVDVFSTLDKVVTDENAVLASNTSSIPVMKLAMATNRPTQVIGIHFFNPVPVMQLVELVTSLLTSEEKEELRKLRRDVKRLRQERDFLKKAAAFFAKENDRPSS